MILHIRITSNFLQKFFSLSLFNLGNGYLHIWTTYTCCLRFIMPLVACLSLLIIYFITLVLIFWDRSFRIIKAQRLLMSLFLLYQLLDLVPLSDHQVHLLAEPLHKPFSLLGPSQTRISVDMLLFLDYLLQGQRPREEGLFQQFSVLVNEWSYVGFLGVIGVISGLLMVLLFVGGEVIWVAILVVRLLRLFKLISLLLINLSAMPLLLTISVIIIFLEISPFQGLALTMLEERSSGVVVVLV